MAAMFQWINPVVMGVICSSVQSLQTKQSDDEHELKRVNQEILSKLKEIQQYI